VDDRTNKRVAQFYDHPFYWAPYLLYGLG
jgi:hypothetical protein